MPATARLNDTPRTGSDLILGEKYQCRESDCQHGRNREQQASFALDCLGITLGGFFSETRYVSLVFSLHCLGFCLRGVHAFCYSSPCTLLSGIGSDFYEPAPQTPREALV